MKEIVYVLLAEGFEEIEAIAPVDLLRRAGVTVETVSIEENKVVTGARGIPVVADITIRQLQFEAMRLLVLPGGYPGYENLEKSAAVKSLLRRAAEAGKEIAAICGAPSVLGKLGLLAGRSATCYPGMEQLLNCSVLTDPVVEDGPFITSRGAGTALAFALALVARVVSPEKAAEIRAGIVMP
ncbi:MAG: DJ-1 family protein [Clostridiales bacterium]|nr:MAG: DJ-1 family protein [Clostridiales bacterium]